MFVRLRQWQPLQMRPGGALSGDGDDVVLGSRCVLRSDGVVKRSDNTLPLKVPIQ